MKQKLSDERVEEEIARLLSSEEVKVAKAERRQQNRRRQYLYSLRSMAKRGRELVENGFTEKDFRGVGVLNK